MTDPRSPLQEAIDNLLRKHTDSANIIEALWIVYAQHVDVPPGGVQWIESRRCFFAGAATLFECMQRILEPGTDEATAADLERLDKIAKELERHLTDVVRGRA